MALGPSWQQHEKTLIQNLSRMFRVWRGAPALAQRYQCVGADPGFMAPQFAVETEQRADQRGDAEPQEQLGPGEESERVGVDHVRAMRNRRRKFRRRNSRTVPVAGGT
jgi:hypothetical protein